MESHVKWQLTIMNDAVLSRSNQADKCSTNLTAQHNKSSAQYNLIIFPFVREERLWEQAVHTFE